MEVFIQVEIKITIKSRFTCEFAFAILVISAVVPHRIAAVEIAADVVGHVRDNQLGLLDHAYAITVHKSQGSEFPAVILAVGDTPRRLRYRNLLYTAITRAKRLLIIVGSDQVVQGMVENDGKLLRYTGLERFLLENDF